MTDGRDAAARPAEPKDTAAHAVEAATSSPSVSTACADEPIHIPEAIQPHGAVLAVVADTRRVTHASANLKDFLGASAASVLRQTLDQILGVTAAQALLSLGHAELDGAGGQKLHLQAHRTGDHICVDIERLSPPPPGQSSMAAAQAVIESFRQASNRDELCERAVRGLRGITGYDRVMAYRFGQDGHGEVVAEARGAVDSYLGLHYPASDIPPQARRLYLRQRVGMIADAAYRPVPLLADPARHDPAPFDLTHSTLRSVSPMHRAYMRNMATAASLTIGLVHRQELWGMLVCHHATPRIAGPELRAAAGIVGQVVSLLLQSLGDAGAFARRLERTANLRTLAQKIATALPLPDALAAAEAELLGLVEAEGALVRLGGVVRRIGVAPAAEACDLILGALHPDAGSDVLALDDLALRHPRLAACRREASGVLLLPLHQGEGDVILWFRPELLQTVLWGGDPTRHGAIDPSTGRISPRASFAAWKQIVSGRSAPWSEADRAFACEFRAVLETEMTQRLRAELALLRHYDPLTGLPNRSLLQERLAATTARHDATRQGGRFGAALLFLDLDRFKMVNDTMGHDAGDRLLIEVAKRLRAAAGPDNLAARLGGDEFVVLCEGLDRRAVTALAERIRRGIDAPFEIAGRPCHVSVSIGIAVADPASAIDLIRAADMAMLAAKRRGGNREMIFEAALLDQATLQFELDQDLREALASDDQLALVYQPLFEIAPGARGLVGFEAMLRWHHPRRGWIAPGLFEPLAEKSGLILPLGEWVLTRVLREGLAFQRQCPDGELQFSVAVTASQLAQPGFCVGFAALLEAEGFPPGQLCLDVGESMLGDAAISAVLIALRQLGVRVAIADFGIGFSSLSSLRHYPVDAVKLDRSFLEAAGHDAGARDGEAFAAAVIALAHAAGMKVVVEGIETPARLGLAMTAGADVVQGALFAPPLSASEARELVARAPPCF